jgi:WD40 repeat protein
VPERRAALAVAVLLTLTAAGCSDDGPDARTTGPGDGDGAGSSGPGASAPFELVATDQLSVSPDGSGVLADCWNGICRWDARDGSLELVPDRGSVAVAPDWSTVATVEAGDVVLEDLDSGEQVTRLTGLADEDVTDGSSVTAVAYSPDATMVAAAGTGDDAGRLVVWTVGGVEEASFDTGGEVHRIEFSPDGDRLATAGNGPVEVHDLVSGESQEVPSGEGGTVAWSPDGDRLVGPGADGQPVVWDTGTWGVAAELRGTRLHEASYAPDGGVLALTLLDSTAVTVWDPAADAPQPRELTGHVDEPGALAWSPDGAVLYSVSADDGVLAWDAGKRPADTTFELPEGR